MAKNKVSCFMGNNDLEMYFMSLGEKGRAEFLDRLIKLPLPSDKRNNSINYDYCTDYRDDVYRAGRSMVYLYTSEMGVPFYVGKGDEMRALSVINRNDSFLEVLEKNGVNRIFSIISNASDDVALEIETLVINELLNRGWRLTNLSKTSVTSDYMRKLTDYYPNVLETINNITRTGLASLLEDKDCFGGTGKVARLSKTYMKNVVTNVV